MTDEYSAPNFDEQIDRCLVPALKVHPIVVGDNSDDLFAAGVADMDFRAPSAVLDALHDRLHHGVFGYEAVLEDLLPSLKRWLAHRHCWQVKESYILRAPNVLNSLAIAASLFTNEGDGIIVQPPVFFDFFDIINENKRRMISNPLSFDNGRYQMDYEDLAKKTSSPQTKMLYLCNPHNPVGRVWRQDELRKLGDICAQNDVLVVTDEIHGDLTFRGHPYTPFASLGPEYADNCISCVSPAKAFNIASCCAAFTIISNADRRKAFQAENSRLTVNKNNAFANVAMQAAYNGGEAWLDAVLAYLANNVKLVREYVTEIPNVQLIEPEGTFLLWLDFTALGYTPEKLTEFLRNQAKWAATRGEAFGDEGAGFARLNIACPRARLKAALRQLKTAISASQI
jgi:cystathionine beta-lyase